MSHESCLHFAYCTLLGRQTCKSTTYEALPHGTNQWSPSSWSDANPFIHQHDAKPGRPAMLTLQHGRRSTMLFLLHHCGVPIFEFSPVKSTPAHERRRDTSQLGCKVLAIFYFTIRITTADFSHHTGLRPDSLPNPVREYLQTSHYRPR